MVIEALAVAAAVVFALLSSVHIYWALGGRAGRSSSVPTEGDRPVLSPSRGATLVVAALLGLSAALIIGGAFGWPPPLIFRAGCFGIGLVLFARSIGDRRYVGLFKRVRDTEFARRDTLIYTPLCLFLAAVATAVGLTSASSR